MPQETTYAASLCSQCQGCLESFCLGSSHAAWDEYIIREHYDAIRDEIRGFANDILKEYRHSDKYITIGEVQAHYNAIRDRTRHFADTLLLKYSAHHFRSDLQVILGKSNKDIILAKEEHVTAVDHVLSKITEHYTGGEVKTGSNYDDLHFTPVLSISPSPVPHVVGQLEQMVPQQDKQYLSMADESLADTDTEIDDSPQESIKARSLKLL